VLWNHGGSTDDLARPGVASLPAPASSYFDGVLAEAVTRRVDQLVVVRGPGRFARAVADGTITGASKRGLSVRTVDATAVDLQDGDRTAVLIVGRFDHDVAVVRQLRARRQSPALVVAVQQGYRPSVRSLAKRPRESSGPCSGGRPLARPRSAHQGPSSSLTFGTGPAPSLPTLPLRLPPQGTSPMPPTTEAWRQRTW
jgi:hypothetical protein